ncbi:fimbrial protein [Pseudomonas yamanorum]|uniref:fimbrial protein n=1 Tax=Pseudomonas yamanorum TaxID=515393 RepID=UPI00087AD1C4|nr:fimbrial protein [Pseudomonas yamanorum]SDU51356.1 Pilin (type 1 fimbria component protein) [Pseudomonas yamanorum]
MKQISLIALAMAAAVSSNAFAETGTLTFTGNLNTSTCTVTPGGSAGSGGSAGVIDVAMGDVSFADLGTVAGDGSVGASFTPIDLGLECSEATGKTSVVMSFDPASGSGLDASDNRLLSLASGGATGAGIALINSNNKIIDLGAGEEIKAPLTVDGSGEGTADFALRATYVSNGGTEAAGVANASLPFLLTYE